MSGLVTGRTRALWHLHSMPDARIARPARPSACLHRTGVGHNVPTLMLDHSTRGSSMRRTFIVIMAFSLMLVAAAPAFARGGPPADIPAPQAAPAPGDQTIADIVVASAEAEEDEEFTLLLAALEYTGLTGVFTGGEQYTVFAPTDEAFVNLVVALDVDPENAFEEIDEALGEGTVANVLLYHVAEGRRAANSVVPPVRDRSITTLLGASFTVSSAGVITDIADQEVDVVATDISASNGVIHVIDTVLLPLD
ncbi:MAG: fasciclin domain-containing protein [Nitriliruptor sp.]|nr:MAG: fasciclin domain-containing protein [Nitriliruptor sp.]